METMLSGNSLPQICVVSVNEFVENEKTGLSVGEHSHGTKGVYTPVSKPLGYNSSPNSSGRI